MAASFFSINRVVSKSCKIAAMKIITKVKALAIGMIAVILCSGCMYPITQSAARIGIRNEALQLQEIIVTTNKEIALGCSAIYFNETKTAEIYRTKKYLLGQPSAVYWTMTNALAQNAARAKQFQKSQRNKSKLEGPTNLVKVTALTYGSTNTMAWQIIPKTYGGHGATTNDLPQEFSGTVAYYQTTNGLFPYEINGSNYIVQFPKNYENPNRTYRKWWGYPLQILVVPAIAIDIIAQPVYFYGIMQQLKYVGSIRG